MKTWKKYAIGGLVALALNGALAVEGNNLKKKAESIRRDYPVIAQLESLEAKKYILEVGLVRYSERAARKKLHMTQIVV